MSHASGKGYSFAIRPVAMRPDDYKIVADRLAAIFRSAPKGVKKARARGPPSRSPGDGMCPSNTSPGHGGAQAVSDTRRETRSPGTHIGWAFEGELKGAIDGDKVQICDRPAGRRAAPDVRVLRPGHRRHDVRRSGSRRIRPGALDRAASHRRLESDRMYFAVVCSANASTFEPAVSATYCLPLKLYAIGDAVIC